MVRFVTEKIKEMEKEDFRIVQTDADKFHIERRIIHSSRTWLGKIKNVAQWMRCDSEGNVYREIARGLTYWRPAPEKPFATLEDTQRQIEKIIDKDNNYPKIYSPVETKKPSS